MPDLSEKAKQNYLRSPNYCPFCNKKNISIYNRRFYDHVIEVINQCGDCNQLWAEIYKIADVKIN